MTITNAGQATLDDDADSDVTVVGSDQHSYQTDIDSIAECTDFNSGGFTIKPGGQASGCVTFEMPTGATVNQVNLTLEGGGPQIGTWQIP